MNYSKLSMLWCWWHLLLSSQKDFTKTKRKRHRPWCEDDTCTLGLGVVWVIAADHHGASGIMFSSATGVNLLTKKVEDKYIGRCKTPLKLIPIDYFLSFPAATHKITNIF